MTSSYRLAQINFSKLRLPLSDPRMAKYVEFLHRVNGLAEASPGFVWRLDERSAAVCGDRIFPEQAPGTTLVNLSVWKSVGALYRYASLGMHGGVLQARRSWFPRYEGRWVALWWVPEGHFPEVTDGWARLQHLRRHQETPYAFNFMRAFPPPGGPQDHLPFAADGTAPERPHGGTPLAAKPAAVRGFLDW